MGIRGRVGESWRAFAQAFRSRELRRLQIAGVGSTLAPAAAVPAASATTSTPPAASVTEAVLASANRSTQPSLTLSPGESRRRRRVYAAGEATE
jgi:hypothetical protein